MSDPAKGAAAPDGIPDDPSDSAADGAAGLSRKDVFSWLGGPRAAVETSGIELGYRGQRLGFPEAGPGSVATFNRRIVAILIDWIASLLVARTIEAQFLDQTTVTRAFLPTLVFFLEISILTTVGGSSFGQRLCGLVVRRVDGSFVSVLRVVLRTFLLCLAVPALIWDRDGRGLHDKAADRWCSGADAEHTDWSGLGHLRHAGALGQRTLRDRSWPRWLSSALSR